LTAMGWMADKQSEAALKLLGLIEPLVPVGDTLTGCVHAMKRGRLSAKLVAVGVTDRHLILQEVDRKWSPNGSPLIVAAADIEVGNIFSEGARFALGDKDQEIRFTTGGEDYKLTVIGGTLFENALAGNDQVDGLQALVQFLRTAPR
jgi:hypothetical protein